MQSLDSYLFQLRNLLQRPCEIELIEELGESPFIEEHELACAIYTLLAQRNKLSTRNLELTQLISGAVPLFRRGFFPWGALPYPREHAEMGTILAQLDNPIYKKMASKMAPYQQATLSHLKKPIYSFFLQERGCLYSELQAANEAFFKAISCTPLDQFEFVDKDLGIVMKRSCENTIACLGSGCKSGMGCFLSHDVGIVNLGPQLLPLGDCEGFGLAGKARQFQYKEEERCVSYQCRMAAPSSRGWPGLKDSGYSGLWIEAVIKFSPGELSLKCCFEGPLSSVAFSFFGSAPSCFVATTHKLNPRSLNRYLGPPQPIELQGKEGSIFLEAEEGASQMEVIPLAGDDSFWGADFLIAYKPTTSTLTFTLTEK